MWTTENEMYEHLTKEQKDKIFTIAFKAVLEDVEQNPDALRGLITNMLSGLSVSSHLFVIEGCKEPLEKLLNFNPKTGKPWE